MDKVVYILGAGFSAPLGLPIMSNFLVKAKDVYFSDPQRYFLFQSVFETINKLSIVKNYFSSDMFNIEEILSILEMQKRLGNVEVAKEFSEFISSVIRYYTPPLTRQANEGWPSNWYDVLFGHSHDDPWLRYGYFVTSLFGLEGDLKSNTLNVSFSERKKADYAIITLNYDLVLESVCDFMNQNLKVQHTISFRRDLYQQDNDGRVPLAKLHGSVDTGNIVPPTWNKYLNDNIAEAWNLAYKSITEANHIRIIGYSLPTSDAYIKYLLKSAVADSKHLKRIDVICRDPDGSVKERYDEFVDFNYYQFFNRDVLDYLEFNKNLIQRIGKRGGVVQMTELELAHERFIKGLEPQNPN